MFEPISAKFLAKMGPILTFFILNCLLFKDELDSVMDPKLP